VVLPLILLGYACLLPKVGLQKDFIRQYLLFLSNIMLKIARLLQKSLITVNNFFVGLFCPENFYSKGVHRINMPMMQTLN